ncbi:MAG TPA: hypothetical protein VJR89_06220 [Polyangiales bacterium]|nr:hypothetical protein [Polyangiales bacterium]
MYKLVMGALASAIAASVVVPVPTQAQETEPPVLNPPKSSSIQDLTTPVITRPRPNEGGYSKEYYQYVKDGYTKELDNVGNPVPWP